MVIAVLKEFCTYLQLETPNLALGPASLSTGERVARPLDAFGGFDIISWMVGEENGLQWVLNTLQVV